ncbi:MAG: hypothetical protein R3230_05190 [Nitrosopumilaceae archaeon]|nr:hypothetical protein [Nitrosopumilaceae archaeon]
MKLGGIVILSILILFTSNSAWAHKPIQTDGMNTDFDNALRIPDHKISWAIYEELEPGQTKFYIFDAKKGDSLYASIVIPKIEKYESYKPELSIIGEGIQVNSNHSIEQSIPQGGIISYRFDGDIPSSEFYEPFTQTTYWERQEIRITIPIDGEYYLAVSDWQNVHGKYSLAVGEIEDFDIIDLFTTLPLAWFQTKLFFEDYPIVIAVTGIFVAIVSFPILRIART